MTETGRNLRWTTHRDGDTLTMKVYGEFDLASAPSFELAAKGLLDETSDLVIALDGVSYMDSTGINAILRLWKLTQQQGIRMRIGDMAPNVAALFQVTKLNNVLEFVGDPPGGAQRGPRKRSPSIWRSILGRRADG